MGQIVCSNCDCTIEYFEDEKVCVIYASSSKCCDSCKCHKK